MDAFVLAHWDRSHGKTSVKGGDLQVPGLLCFETCRRVLWLSFDGRAEFSTLLNRGIELDFYEGSGAYKFLLEIISGLHSPIYGETEVLGQFREFIRKTAEANNHLSAQFRPWSIFLLEDSKTVRHG